MEDLWSGSWNALIRGMRLRNSCFGSFMKSEEHQKQPELWVNSAALR